jgi:curli biogenesis system outer membrane secretion channel CsgG
MLRMKKYARIAAVAALVVVTACGGGQKKAKEPKQDANKVEMEEPLPEQHGPKKRIAIVDFEDTTHSNVAEAARDVATEILVKSGAFVVVEREQLAAVLREQGLGQSGAINPMTAAQAGKVLGLQAIITGKVTDFADQHRKSGFGSFSKSSRIAKARVSIRMTDATSGETWLAESGEGEAKEGSTYISGIGSGSRDENLGKNALYVAIHKMMRKILEQSATKPWSSTVAKANAKDGKVYITAGSSAGLAPGTTLTVTKQGEEIRDPSTDMVIGHEKGQEVGKLEVDSDLNEKVTVCKIVSGTDYGPGDVVAMASDGK